MQSNHRVALLLVAGLTAAAMLSTAAGASQAGNEEVAPVHLIASDFSFVLDRTIIPAGARQFDVLNLSQEYKHEVWIYPIDERDTPEFQEMLALKRAGERVEEPNFIRGIVGRSGEVAAGEAMTFPAPLPAGIYEIACLAREGTGNVRTLHYDEGMYTVIAVRAPAPS